MTDSGRGEEMKDPIWKRLILLVIWLPFFMGYLLWVYWKWTFDDRR